MNDQIHEETQHHQAYTLMSNGYNMGAMDTKQKILGILIEHLDIKTLVEVDAVIKTHLELPTYEKRV